MYPPAFDHYFRSDAKPVATNFAGSCTRQASMPGVEFYAIVRVQIGLMAEMAAYKVDPWAAGWVV